MNGMIPISESAIKATALSGKVASVFGWPVTVFFGISALVGIFETEAFEGKSIVVVFSCFWFAVGLFLIVHGRKTKHRIKRFRRYVEIITQTRETSFHHIAGTASQTVDFVVNDLRKMISKGFFVGAHLDLQENRIVIPGFSGRVPVHVQSKINTEKQVEEVRTVTCTGCGASNQITAGSAGECEFCGSPIQA